jgi:hypothetical protein
MYCYDHVWWAGVQPEARVATGDSDTNSSCKELVNIKIKINLISVSLAWNIFHLRQMYNGMNRKWKDGSMWYETLVISMETIEPKVLVL